MAGGYGRCISAKEREQEGGGGFLKPRCPQRSTSGRRGGCWAGKGPGGPGNEKETRKGEDGEQGVADAGEGASTYCPSIRMGVSKGGKTRSWSVGEGGGRDGGSARGREREEGRGEGSEEKDGKGQGAGGEEEDKRGGLAVTDLKAAVRVFVEPHEAAGEERDEVLCEAVDEPLVCGGLRDHEDPKPLSRETLDDAETRLDALSFEEPGGDASESPVKQPPFDSHSVPSVHRDPQNGRMTRRRRSHRVGASRGVGRTEKNRSSSRPARGATGEGPNLLKDAPVHEVFCRKEEDGGCRDGREGHRLRREDADRERREGEVEGEIDAPKVFLEQLKGEVEEPEGRLRGSSTL